MYSLKFSLHKINVYVSISSLKKRRKFNYFIFFFLQGKNRNNNYLLYVHLEVHHTNVNAQNAFLQNWISQAEKDFPSSRATQFLKNQAISFVVSHLQHLCQSWLLSFLPFPHGQDIVYVFHLWKREEENEACIYAE